MKYILTILLVIVTSLLLGSNSFDGKSIIDEKNLTHGQNIMYATVAGGGDCSDWGSACTFREAIAKTTSGVLDVVYLGVGSHNLDNLSDATGTTISSDYVNIVGVGLNRHDAKLVNSDGAPTHVLILTGGHVYIKNVGFVEDDTIQLDIRSSDNMVDNCEFKMTGGAGVGTGVKISNSSDDNYVLNSHILRIPDYGIHTDGTTELTIKDNFISTCGTGVHVDGAADSDFLVTNNHIDFNTTGVLISGATVSNLEFSNISFLHNTTNLSDTSGAWDSSHWENISSDHMVSAILPANGGTTVTTGDGVWTWTAAPTTIIAADVITTPFIITNINVQVYDADQTYKINVFYGEAVANISLGIYEFTVGATNRGITSPAMNLTAARIPSNSIIGIETMSSTADTDDLDVTFTFDAL